MGVSALTNDYCDDIGYLGVPAAYQADPALIEQLCGLGMSVHYPLHPEIPNSPTVITQTKKHTAIMMLDNHFERVDRAMIRRLRQSIKNVPLMLKWVDV
jgi:hypothetical protein